MANISQEGKKDIQHNLKKVLRKYPKINIRYSVSIRNNTSLTLTIYESNIDLLKPFRNNKNPQFGFGVGAYDIFCYTGQIGKEAITNYYKGEMKSFMLDLNNCINDGNFCKYREDSETFAEGWYTSIFLGNKNQDFIYNSKYSKKKRA